MRRYVALALGTLVGLAGLTSSSIASAWLIPPVDAAIARRFEPPGTEWGPGHRGIDYAVPSGTAIRAVADGRVLFAGPVAGTQAVTIAHRDGLASTYSDLAEVLVSGGDVIDQGTWVGRAGRAHDGIAGLHLGIKLDGEYMDPESFIGPLDTSTAIRLAPLVWEPPSTLPASFRTPFLSATGIEQCAPTPPSGASAATASDTPPNGNVAVLIAGIGSRTEGGMSAALYEAGGRPLGYPASDTYRFSYRGIGNSVLHEPYQPADTFGDIRVAAERLRELLERIAFRHPGRQVDLIAHSQGGLVARAYLQLIASAWDPEVPQVEHLVTFSSPHEGAPLAGGVPGLDRTSLGHALLEGASKWSNHGGPIPDPRAPSVAQMAPGSALLDRLDSEAVLYGTRVLSLAIPNDVVVPADHARWDGYPSTVVPPRGLNGHDAVVTSDVARAIAKRFLRDGPMTCRSGWDRWGPRIGGAISTLERGLPWMFELFDR